MEFNLLELKAQRVRQGKTQEDLAKVLGIKTNTYSKKEAGTIKITVEEFQKICNYLKIKNVNIFFTQSVDKFQQ